MTNFGTILGTNLGSILGTILGSILGTIFGVILWTNFLTVFKPFLTQQQELSSIDLVSTHFLKIGPIFFWPGISYFKSIHKILRFYLNEFILAKNRINSYPDLILFFFVELMARLTS